MQFEQQQIDEVSPDQEEAESASQSQVHAMPAGQGDMASDLTNEQIIELLQQSENGQSEQLPPEIVEQLQGIL